MHPLLKSVLHWIHCSTGAMECGSWLLWVCRPPSSSCPFERQMRSIRHVLAFSTGRSSTWSTLLPTMSTTWRDTTSPAVCAWLPDFNGSLGFVCASVFAIVMARNGHSQGETSANMPQHCRKRSMVLLFCFWSNSAVVLEPISFVSCPFLRSSNVLPMILFLFQSLISKTYQLK